MAILTDRRERNRSPRLLLERAEPGDADTRGRGSTGLLAAMKRVCGVNPIDSLHRTSRFEQCADAVVTLATVFTKEEP